MHRKKATYISFLLCLANSNERNMRSYLKFYLLNQTETCRDLDLGSNKGKNVDNKTFASILGVKIRTIQRTRKTLEESKDPRGVIKRSPKSLEDNRKLRNADFVKKVETMINNKPSQPMRSMAAEPKVENKPFNVVWRICTAKVTECKLVRFWPRQPRIKGCSNPANFSTS